MYRVYSGPAGSETLSPLDKGRHLFKECASWMRPWASPST